MKLWKVLQLVLAVYGVWSIYQGVTFNKAPAPATCAVAGVQEMESSNYHFSMAPGLARMPTAQSSLAEQRSRVTLEKLRDDVHFIF